MNKGIELVQRVLVGMTSVAIVDGAITFIKTALNEMQRMTGTASIATVTHTLIRMTQQIVNERRATQVSRQDYIVNVVPMEIDTTVRILSVNSAGKILTFERSVVIKLWNRRKAVSVPAKIGIFGLQ